MLRRRLVTIPAYIIGWALWVAAAPVWLVLAMIVDLLRGGGGVALRSAALLTVYLSCEIVGMLASAGLWACNAIVHMDSQRWIGLHFRLQACWGASLFKAVVLLFGLRLEVEGEDAADLGRGPYLLLLRHASVVDALLASALVSRPHGIRLRYVLKQELLWDPCLDIVGNRLPNVFVDRVAHASDGEVRRVQALGGSLGRRDGVLIYPEGTRFSQAKRARALDRLRQEGDVERVEYAESLMLVLPPRPGGTLGLLEAAPEADVIVCAHTGLERAGSLEAIWRGELLHRVIRVQLRRIPRHEIPSDRVARVAWLLKEWQRVSAWIESRGASR